MNTPDLILHNGKIATVNPQQPEAQAVAVGKGRLIAVGADGDVLRLEPRPPVGLSRQPCIHREPNP
jgi:predicted amidohydrolase YtcJ